MRKSLRWTATVVATVNLAILLAVLLFAGIVAAQDKSSDTITPTGLVSAQYDRFEQKTTIALDDMKLQTPPGSSLILFLRGYFPGEAAKVPMTVGLSVVSLSLTGYDRPESCTLNVIADDDRFKYSLNRYKQMMYLVIFYGQAFRVDVPYAEFRRIARSQVVEMRLCDTEFKVTTEQLAQFNAFRKRLGDEDK